MAMAQSTTTSHRHRKTLNIPGHAHALTFSCYRRYPFLTRPRTCQWLADAINQASAELGYKVLAYVMMPEHVHLLVFPNHASYDISAFTRALKQPVSRQAMRYLEKHEPQWLPRLTRTRGKKTERLFWQSGGGYDRNIVEPGTLHATVDYIHENPVRRGLVKQAVDWSWSSARGYAGIHDDDSQHVRIDPIQV